MKLTISLLLCSLLIGFLTSTSQAAQITQKPVPIQDQETQQDETLPQPGGRSYGQAFIMLKKLICNDSEVIFDLLKSEPGPQVPVFSGLIRTPQGDVKMMAQIFIDKENRKFSIVESSTEGISCVISAGFDFDILPHSHPGDVQKGSGQEVNKETHKLPQKVRMQN